jgi:hypothetical protein
MLWEKDEAHIDWRQDKDGGHGIKEY